MKINVQILTAELQAAGLPVTGVWYDSGPYERYGINYSRELTKDEKLTEKAVLEIHDPYADDKSKQEQAKVTDGDKLAALWAAVADGDMKKVDEIKAKLAQVSLPG
jgi:hypothetical protein